MIEKSYENETQEWDRNAIGERRWATHSGSSWKYRDFLAGYRSVAIGVEVAIGGSLHGNGRIDFVRQCAVLHRKQKATDMRTNPRLKVTNRTSTMAVLERVSTLVGPTSTTDRQGRGAGKEIKQVISTCRTACCKFETQGGDAIADQHLLEEKTEGKNEGSCRVERQANSRSIKKQRPGAPLAQRGQSYREMRREASPHARLSDQKARWRT